MEETLRTAIVEDEDAAARDLEECLKRYCGKRGITCSTERFRDGRAFLEQYSPRYDLIFMDIRMPEVDGMAATQRLRELDRVTALVFVTSMVQYAVKGYEVDAFDFMVKPVSYGGFTMKLRRLCQYLAAKRKCEICVSTRHGKFLVKADDIKYVEVMRHVVTYNTVKGKVVGSGTLKQVMETLKGLPFALCNRCYLVNLRYVTQIVGREVTVGGDSLLISAPRSREFMAAFNRYLSTGGKVK